MKGSSRDSEKVKRKMKISFEPFYEEVLMNFKRLRGIYAVALITIAAALLAGCMNSMAGSVSGGENRGVSVLHFSTTLPAEYAKEYEAYDGLNPRSIMPDTPFDINAGLAFRLEGKSANGNAYPSTEVKLVSINDGVYDFQLTNGDPVVLDSMLWNITLWAYELNATNNPPYDTSKPVLVGRTVVDLRDGSSTATIVMGISGLDTVAPVTVYGTVKDTDNVANYYTAGIYTKVGLEQLEYVDGNIGDNNGIDNSFIFNKTVSPGIYLFIINFYTDAARKQIIGSYTDTIVINPGNTLEQDIGVLDCIRKLPTEPKDLMASVIKQDGDTFLLKVEWTESDYVTNYELNLATFDDNYGVNDGDVVTNAEINTYFDKDSIETNKYDINYHRIINGKVYGIALMDGVGVTAGTTAVPINNFVESVGVDGIFGNGSSPMMYGDTSCILKLKTGKVYEIQLRARNYYGVSEWVDRGAYVAPAPAPAPIDTYAAPAQQHINRMYVYYKLNGGELKVGGADKPGTTYVDYHSWTANAALLKDGADMTLISKGGAAFDSWLLETGIAINADGNETDEFNARVNSYTYKNTQVIASYGNRLSGNVTQEDDIKDINRTDANFSLLNNDKVVIASGMQATYATREAVEVSKLDVNKKSTYIQVVLINAFETGTFSTTDKYTNVRAEAWTGDYITGPVAQIKMETPGGTVPYGMFNVSTEKYGSGETLSIMITADTVNAKGVSQTYQFTLK